MTIRSTILLLILSVMLFLPGICKMSITDRDDGNYAQASKQMIETGNYLQINVQTRQRHLKPPGIYWLHTLSIHAFNNGNPYAAWPYRIPSVFGAFLAALMTFLFGRRLLGQRKALIAGILLLCCFFITLQAHMISTDTMLMACITIMQCTLWLLYAREEGGNLLALLFWVAMAAGILVKGLAPLFAVLTIITLSIIDKDRLWLKRLKFSWGIPLVLLLTCAWLIPVSLSSHSNFLMDMIRKDIYHKLVGGEQGHGMPPGYFFVTFFAALWPSSLLLFHGIYKGFNERKDHVYRFLLAWIIPNWICFEIIPTKLPEYLMPIYPAICLLMASALIDFKDVQYTRKMKIIQHLASTAWFVCGILISGFFLFASFKLTHLWMPSAIFSFVAAILTNIIALAALHKKKVALLMSTLTIGAILTFAPLYEWTLPGLWPLWMSKRVAETLTQLPTNMINDQQPLLAVGYVEPSLVFYVGTKRVLYTDLNNAITQLSKGQSHLLLIKESEQSPMQGLLEKSKLKLKLIQSYRGFNYNEGSRWETLNLYQKSK